MCGIYGVLADNLPPTTESLTKLEILKHRGPDFLSYKELNNQIFLGHTRLSILDLSNRANQPFQDRSRNFTITFNGEVYNYLEIRQELETLGYQFTTTSDTEVVLYAFIEWKEQCLFKFNGMWAFAIWNAAEKMLFLSRDRFGVKPLYLLHTKEQFQFASELKVFAAKSPINDRYVSVALTTTPVDHLRETFLQGVQQLLPGEYAWVTSSSIRIQKYWETSEHLPNISSSPDALVEQFYELLSDACRLRMRSDVPIATALSGGLDSSAISSLIAMNNDQSFTAFIAHYPNSSQDEYEFAKELVDRKNIPSQTVEISAQECIDSLDSIIYATEDCINLATGPYLLYQAYKSRNAKISIDGHGADELLAGYLEYPQIPLSKKILKQSPLRSMDMLLTLHRMGFEASEISKKMITGFGKVLYKRSRRLLNTGTTSTPYTAYPAPSLPENFLERDFLDQALYLDFHYYKLPPILRRFDRCSMAHGVEIRSPFLDWRLVTFLFALPSTYKLKNGYTKAILRKSMQNILPPKILKRTQKLGFTNPMEDWFENASYRNYLLDHCHSKGFQESSYFDGKAVANDLLVSKNVSSSWRFIHLSRMLELFKENRLKRNVLT